MLKSLFILDLPLNASNEDIRKKYLSLVKEYTPEKHPAQFHKITSAYEQVKDKRSRIRSRIFSAIGDINHEETLMSLADSARFTKRRAGLKELINATKKVKTRL